MSCGTSFHPSVSRPHRFELYAKIKTPINKGITMRTPIDKIAYAKEIACAKRRKPMIKQVVPIFACAVMLFATGCASTTPVRVWQDLATVKMSVEQGRDVNNSDINGDTPLFWASIHGSQELVELLLKKGASINVRNKEGNTPLIAAAYMGHLNVLNALAKNGADINGTNLNGTTALMAAAEMGNFDIVKSLAACGASLEARDKSGCTALHKASPIFIVISDGSECLGIKKAQVKEPTKEIYENIWNGRNKVAQFLIEAGVDVNARDRKGNTPLMRCHENILKLLLNHNADVNAVNQNGSTALILAALFGSLPSTRLLIEKGANVNAIDNDGDTPLLVAAGMFAAAMKEQSAVVKLLVENGANVNAVNKKGETPLSRIVRVRVNGMPQYDVIEFLVDKGANVNKSDSNGNTPLEQATASGDDRLIKLLKAHGAK
jgi:ankyrin repeat protein